MLCRPSGMAVCRLCRGVFVVDGSGMGVKSTSLAIGLSGSFADAFLQGRSASSRGFPTSLCSASGGLVLSSLSGGFSTLSSMSGGFADASS